MRRTIVCILLFALILPACTRSADTAPSWTPATSEPVTTSTSPVQTFMPPTRPADAPIASPTPDVTREMPSPQPKPGEYTVMFGDTLGTIAEKFNLTVDQLISSNKISDPNTLYPGQVLKIPTAVPVTPDVTVSGATFKVIPDSELVYGPLSATFDIAAYVQMKGGYLAHFTQEVDGETLSGAQIVEKVARNYSVNPRLLLAVLEYRSNWVSVANPSPATNDNPIHYVDDFHAGLYRQLTWSANALNFGFYAHQARAVSTWTLADDTVIPIDPGINAGTAGVQHFFAQIDDLPTWQLDTNVNGLFATYFLMFGYPFDFAIEPLVPPGLTQPLMQLPFEQDSVWSFTGGPHGGWDTGSAWAALDFAPPGEPMGCVVSEAWAVAVADGLIIRAKNGAVVEDLDGDGLEQTGWTVLYMHMADEGRVQPGTYVHAGDHIGRPSCEGGLANAAHLHIARRYNGVWITADRDMPFIMDGWVSSGSGIEYDGSLTRSGVAVKAWDGQTPENQISR
jgi:LasA protease